MRKSICCILLLSLVGCAGTVPASGSTSDGEQFTGSFSKRSDGIAGVVKLNNDRGTACEGRWHLDEEYTGSASMTCSDGRTGTVELSVQSESGTMKGMLGGKPFKGTFQDPVREMSR